MPVNFDFWEMLDCILVFVFGDIFDGLFVRREKSCETPSTLWLVGVPLSG
jgi:hypothetical protein